MTERECRPPEDVKTGTYHWCHHPHEGLVVMLWHDPWEGFPERRGDLCGWYTFFDEKYYAHETKEWRYVAPCIPPEGGAHG
ncbi:hypothetical protein [Kozakia baliensis]|uniref:hypothetical protein n=1 Tax=Kozakia baliensis TaxID=153496 RepID=UPI000496B40D|nr:hypothetical protein [Kozakia baliensis]